MTAVALNEKLLFFAVFLSAALITRRRGGGGGQKSFAKHICQSVSQQLRQPISGRVNQSFLNRIKLQYLCAKSNLINLGLIKFYCRPVF